MAKKGNEFLEALRHKSENAQDSVRGLKTEIKDLRDQLLNLEKGTDEYNNVLQQAAEKQHQLREQMELVNATAMDAGQIFSNVTKAVGGMVSGFQAVTAVMNLFGIQNEDVLKSLQKMQSIMALTQSFSGIEKGIKAFKNLGIVIKSATAAMSTLSKALLASGIGAFAVVVGLLAANWDKVTHALGLATGAQREYDDELRQSTLKQANDELQRRVALTEKIATLEGKSGSEAKKEVLRIYEEEKNLIDDNVRALTDLQNAEAKLSNAKLGNLLQDDMKVGITNTKELEDAVKDAQITFDNAAQSLANFRSEFTGIETGIITDLKTLKTQQTDVNANIEKTQGEIHDLEILEKAQAKADKEAADKKRWKEKQEEIKKAAEALSAFNHQLEVQLSWDRADLDPKPLQQEIQERIAGKYITVPVKVEPEVEEDDTSFEDAFREKIEGTVQSLRDAFKTPDEVYEEEKHALDLAFKTKLISQQEYNDLSAQLLKEHEDAVRRTAINEAQYYFNALDNIGSTIQSIAGMIDQSTEEGEKKYKDMMYASTVISTLAGVAGAIASAFMPVNAGMTPIGQAIAAATMATSVLASGIAQLVQIKNANKNSTLGGKVTGNISSPSQQAIATINAPVQYTQDLNSVNIESAIKAQKVYVVESDITNTQKKVSVAESEATY